MINVFFPPLSKPPSPPPPKKKKSYLTLSSIYKSFENTVRKGEIARNEQFHLYPPTVFFNDLENSLPFSSHLKLSSANSLNSEESKICCLGKG